MSSASETGPGHEPSALPTADRRGWTHFPHGADVGVRVGTASYVLVRTAESDHRAFSSACHGSGRGMSRDAALKRYRGRQVVDDLAREGIIIRSPSLRGVAEEAPGAYKDVSTVVDVADHAGFARKVARLRPLIRIKG